MSELNESQLFPSPDQSNGELTNTQNSNFTYLRSVPGVVKIICLVCELLAIIQIKIHPTATNVSLEIFMCVVGLAMFVTGLLTVLHVTKFIDVIDADWRSIEITYDLIISLGILIGLTAILCDHGTLFIMPVVLAIILTVAYTFDAFFQNETMHSDNEMPFL